MGVQNGGGNTPSQNLLERTQNLLERTQGHDLFLIITRPSEGNFVNSHPHQISWLHVVCQMRYPLSWSGVMEQNNTKEHISAFLCVFLKRQKKKVHSYNTCCQHAYICSWGTLSDDTINFSIQPNAFSEFFNTKMVFHIHEVKWRQQSRFKKCYLATSESVHKQCIWNTNRFY
jgi:hypothetical protein